jgi:hypothetical protein
MGRPVGTDPKGFARRRDRYRPATIAAENQFSRRPVEPLSGHRLPSGLILMGIVPGTEHFFV